MTFKSFRDVRTDISRLQNIDVYTTILLCLAIVALDLLNLVGSEIVAPAILTVLSMEAFSLLSNRRIQHDLYQSLEEIRNHPYRLSDTFTPFSKRMDELSEHLARANEIWILSRTCRRLWSDFGDRLQDAGKRDGLRLLVLDPDDCARALDLLKHPAVWDEEADRALLRQSVRLFLQGLENFCGESDLTHIKVRKIDYLPAWTLILINPNRPDGMVYVEMATYRSHPRGRPCFVIRSDTEYGLFIQFCDEFEDMWKDAQPAWEQTKT